MSDEMWRDMPLITLRMRKQGGALLAAFSCHEEGLYDEGARLFWEVHRDSTDQIEVPSWGVARVSGEPFFFSLKGTHHRGDHRSWGSSQLDCPRSNLIELSLL